MLLRIVGASCILIVCGGFGFHLAANQLYEERTLRELIRILDYMENELVYRMLPLPVLCRAAAEETRGILGRMLSVLAVEMENQISPNVDRCMDAAILKTSNLPPYTKTALIQLGKLWGRFDLQGQIKGMDSVRRNCKKKLKSLEQGKENRIRGYKTLGLCAGAALVILFI